MTNIINIHGTVTEINGGMEYQDNIILSYNPEEMSEHEAFLTVARDWRGEVWSSWNEQEYGFWSDYSLIQPFSPSHSENPVPEDHMDILRKYMACIYVTPKPDDNGETYSDYFDSEGNFLLEETA